MEHNKHIESSHYEKLKREYESLSIRYQQGSILQYFDLKMKPTEDPIAGCYGLSSFFSALDFLTVDPTKIYVREDGSYKAVDDTKSMFTIYSRFLIGALEELLSKEYKPDTKRIMFLATPYGMGKTHLTRLFLAYSMKLKDQEDISNLEMRRRKGMPQRLEIDCLTKDKDFETLEEYLGNAKNKISLLAFMLKDSFGWCILDSGKKITRKLQRIMEYKNNFLMIIPASPLDLAYLERFEKEFLDEYVHVVLIAHYKGAVRDLIERKLQYISSSYENDYSLSILEKSDHIRQNFALEFLESSAISRLVDFCKGNPAIALRLLERSFEIAIENGEQMVSEETMVETSTEMKLDLDKYQIGLHVRRERGGVGRINYLISLLGSSKRRAGTVSKITGSSIARVSTLLKEIEGLQKKGRVYNFSESLLALLEGEIIDKIVIEELDEITAFNNLQKDLNTTRTKDASECLKGVDST